MAYGKERMMIMITNDRRSWLWLLVGAALLPFTQFQTVLSLAGWLAPIFLLRFTRTRRARVALPVVTLAHYVAGVVALRGILPAPALYLFGLAGVVGVVSYAADLVLARRLSGLARTLVFPAAAVTVDWLFGLSLLGTLGSPAYAQFGDLPLTQLVSVTGIWGLTFLVNWLAPVVNEIWERGVSWRAARYSLAPFAGVLLGAALLGGARLALAAPAAPAVRVAALAADRALWHGLTVPRLSELAAGSDAQRAAARAQFAPIVDELLDRSRQQARAGAKIVLWSEAAAFALKEDEPALVARARELAQAEGIYLQISVVFALRTDRYPFGENRTLLIDPRGQVAWDYYKTVHPLDDANIFAPGPGVIPIVDTPYGRLATAICFDADFPALIRQAGQARADILLVPANDWQPVDVLHARAATFRAVENGVALVRATGNGLSIAVDSLGRPLATADYYATDKLTMVASLPTRGTATLYARIGDSLAYVCAAGLIGLACLAFVRRHGVRLAAQQPAYKQYN
jgi:apolipoprotein N-acyltransferase